MIRSSFDGAVATITLDRPEARNAVTVAGWRALAEAVATIPVDTRVLVLTGAGGGFSGGADLPELARLAGEPSQRAPFREAMRAAIDGLAAVRVPTVAAVSGGCFGAAVALACAADIVVADAGARFAVPPARLGIAYPAEDVARIAARVGRAQTARLFFTAAPVDAAEAVRIGLVDLVGDGAELARAIAANDRAATTVLKRMIADPDDPGHAAAFDATFDSTAFRAATQRFRGA